ncbi:MAG TPA: hypothetical protein VKU40_07215 [Thermoanaerobaculia bacterium]|nr:hypothetical protein [Thermoanaerobaculia bacterium]
MSTTMIQIRNVPDELHRQVKARAALAGKTMSDYLLHEVERLLRRPSRQEVLARLSALPPVELSESPADVIRRDRDSR